MVLLKADLKNKVSLGFSLITFKVFIPFQPNFYSISTIGNPNIFSKRINWIFRLSMISDILYESILQGAAVPKMLNLTKIVSFKGAWATLYRIVQTNLLRIAQAPLKHKILEGLAFSVQRRLAKWIRIKYQKSSINGKSCKYF